MRSIAVDASTELRFRMQTPLSLNAVVGTVGAFPVRLKSSIMSSGIMGGIFGELRGEVSRVAGAER